MPITGLRVSVFSPARSMSMASIPPRAAVWDAPPGFVRALSGLLAGRHRELLTQACDELRCAVERRSGSEHGVVGSLERHRDALLAEPARVAACEVGDSSVRWAASSTLPSAGGSSGRTSDKSCQGTAAMMAAAVRLSFRIST